MIKQFAWHAILIMVLSVALAMPAREKLGTDRTFPNFHSFGHKPKAELPGCRLREQAGSIGPIGFGRGVES